MQHPAGLDLPHTRTRPVHWLATAAALAAVVGAAAFVQPAAATAKPARHTASAPAPDAAKASYPLHCDPDPVAVVQHASGDLDGDGRPETVAVARCRTGIGTPPGGLYVLAPAHGTPAPRVVAELVSPKQQTNIEDLKVTHGTISATLLGYSAESVPRCCPDRRTAVRWQWRGGKFVESEHEVAPPAAQGAQSV
ncbi:hypothetical protein ACFV3R_26895 [Streptomyces sp. NPDC059740]|uniref:hypothetical protein n=1 Tax=Streptomyces sp. NPDC059740 TaxID=3346926 RepID=UPI003662759E